MPFAFSCPGREQAASLSRAGSGLGLLFPHGKDATQSTRGAETGVRRTLYPVPWGPSIPGSGLTTLEGSTFTQILHPHPALLTGPFIRPHKAMCVFLFTQRKC